jgi:spore germination protein KA
LEGGDRFLSIKSFSVEGRAVEEPTTQSIVRGPKEGFIEKAGINIALVRKRIKNKALRVENLLSGSVTNTKIALMYIDGIARKDIVDEIRNRIEKIKIDGILDSGYIEELIKDDRYSIFPEFLNSERPDAITAELLEGKVAIFVDGTSYVLTPLSFLSSFFSK